MAFNLTDLKTRLQQSIEEERKKNTPHVGVLDVAKEIPGAAKSVAKSIFGFAKSIPKDAVNTLIVNPGTRIGQATAYGLGAATKNEYLKQAAFDDTNINLGKLGNYDVKGQKTGSAGTRQIGGQALKTASYLYAPGKAVGAIAKQTLKQAIFQGAKAGAIGGGLLSSGESLQQDQFSGKKLAKDTAIGTGLGALAGAGFGGAGFALGKQIKQTKQVVQTRINDLIDQGYSRQEAEKFATEAGFIRNPFNGKDLETSGQLPKSRFGQTNKKVESQLKQSGKSLLGKKQSPALSSVEKDGDVSSYYNVDRLNINDKAKQAIQGEINNAKKELEETVGKTLTNKEVIDRARLTSDVLKKTVSREQTAQKIAVDLKLRQQIASSASGKIDENFVKLWMQDKAAGEDIARQLQARRIGADPKDTELIDTILNAIYKVNKNADEIAYKAETVDFNNPEEVAVFYREFVKPKASEWVDLLRYNSMLTSPNTHIVNISSNFQGTGILAPIEKTVTGFVDATRSALNGKPRQYAIGEGASYAKGYYSNIANATKNFISVIKGSSLIKQPDIRRIPLTTGSFGKNIGRTVERTLDLPLRLLEASDQFFTTLTEGGVNSSLAYRASKGITNEGNAGEEAAKRLFRGKLNDPNQGYVLDAIDGLTNLIQRARNSENPVLSTIAKFTLPFVRTPTEILKQGIEYSPLGLSTLAGATNKTEQLSKVIIGTASAMGAALLLGQDRLTWAEPISEKQRAEFKAAGRQAYSVKIGNKWVSYSKLHPAVAFNFALIAAIDDAEKNKGLDDSQAESILTAFAKWGNFLADQSYLKNIGDFVSATKGSVGGYSKLASNYPQQLIPFRGLASWIERLIDPVQRQADPNGGILDRQMQYFMAQLPGLAQKVPTRKSSLGEDLPNQNRLFNAFSPNRITTENAGYEGLYQLNQSKRQLDKLKSDLKANIEKELQLQ